MDLLGRYSLIFAVVPLGEIVVNDRDGAETRQLARLTRALHRAAEDEREVLFGKHRPKFLGEPAPILRQRDIRGPRVLAAEAPRGLSMSDREHVHARPPEAQTLSASNLTLMPDGSFFGSTQAGLVGSTYARAYKISGRFSGDTVHLTLKNDVCHARQGTATRRTAGY